MGLARLDRIVDKLREHGAPASRPVALIAQGTTPDQQVIASTLEDIRGLPQVRMLRSPALLVVGEVAALHQTLAWFGAGLESDVSESA
jgi:uroporphyrin-III C-methyltransferase/precorrin-2 dehydrogenase/sirohydrochlorin ferrochelatase